MAWKSTFLHILELVLVLIIAYLIQQFFNVSNELIIGLVVLVLGGLSKLVRSSDNLPGTDWVNK
jgi:hypothetical protein